jgi:hypothetical protein
MRLMKEFTVVINEGNIVFKNFQPRKGHDPIHPKTQELRENVTHLMTWEKVIDDSLPFDTYHTPMHLPSP